MWIANRVLSYTIIFVDNLPLTVEIDHSSQYFKGIALKKLVRTIFFNVFN